MIAAATAEQLIVCKLLAEGTGETFYKVPNLLEQIGA